MSRFVKSSMPGTCGDSPAASMCRVVYRQPVDQQQADRDEQHRLRDPVRGSEVVECEIRDST